MRTAESAAPPPAPPLAPSLASAAPAKLNLYLHVTGKRDDGYHLLDSLIAFAALHDTVHTAPAADVSLRVDGPLAAGVPADSENLVFKAAEKMRAAFGIKAGCALRLTKRLPAAAGVGGGSSDAAAAMRGLCRLWGIAPDDPALFEIARSLGADVPMCLAGRTAFAAGAGEDLTPAPDLPQIDVVLVNPGVPLAAADVFKARTGGFSKPARFSGPVADAAALAAHLAERGNDLTHAAETLAPEIIEVRRALEAQPGVLLARMSGSGATCFGLFESAAAAKAAARAVTAGQPPWRAWATRLIKGASTLTPDLD